MTKQEEIKFAPDEIENTPMVDDVVGVGKQFIEDVILSIENKKVFEKTGLVPDKSFLLEGQPGTGKTYSVKALRNTLNKEFLKDYERYEQQKMINPDFDEYPKPNVIFFSYDIGKYGTSYINQGSKIVEKFFENAYFHSLVLPTFIIMDEADALLSKRGMINRSHKEDDKVLETIMKNLQIAHDTNDMYVIMMTNFRDLIDNAVLRAGRIDKKYKFELPDHNQLFELYEKAIDKLNHRADYQVIRRVNINNLVELSEGFNGADVFNVVEQTLKDRVLNYLKTRENKVIPQMYVVGDSIEKKIMEYQTIFKEKKKEKIGF